ncbi:hypothetical protein CI109_102148 [Kwoniella shandongensis]|uniref:Uncharacterized protein n=1 Tax=Kwoniella shandongensis TaxID=1734106 RepID=A0A5M6BYV4_9TREE|nr:uncharacterized protein CI109_003693 [Kwoniella shandongensis]KAA5528038.1 hypothetical protein CI109_003693 [Kwoniella shandongensis]
MVNIQAQFDKAVAIINNPANKTAIETSTDEKLQFYGAYKQANEGDYTNGKAPGTFDFTGKAKYNAWKKNEGLSKEQAQAIYVELFKSIIQKSEDEESKKFLEEVEQAGAQ